MAKIVVHEDCGNAPKKQFILDFLTALANMDVDTALYMLADDARLDIVGRNTYDGKEAIKKIIVKDGSRSKVAELNIANIVSHGDRCAANGTLHFADGGTVAFNNMYTFNSHGKRKIEASRNILINS